MQRGGLEIIDEFKETIAPTYYTKLHTGVKKVTGLTQSDIAAGRPFPEAIFDFRVWCGSPCLLLTWGRDDIPMLLDNLFVHNIDAGWITDCYDLQPIYNQQTDGQKQQRALSARTGAFRHRIERGNAGARCTQRRLLYCADMHEA